MAWHGCSTSQKNAHVQQVPSPATSAAAGTYPPSLTIDRFSGLETPMPGSPCLPHNVYSCCFIFSSLITSPCWLAMSTYLPGKFFRCSCSSGFKSLIFLAGLPAHTWTGVCLCVCVCVCARVCMYVCVCVRACLCACHDCQHKLLLRGMICCVGGGLQARDGRPQVFDVKKMTAFAQQTTRCIVSQ